MTPDISELIERLEAYMGKADIGDVLKDCRLAAAALRQCSEQAGDMVDKAAAWDACVKAREEERERCAKIAEPKGPRPCDCEYGACYCRNAGDAAAVASWDADMAVARAIRAPVSGSGDANG